MRVQPIPFSFRRMGSITKKHAARKALFSRKIYKRLFVLPHVCSHTFLQPSSVRLTQVTALEITQLRKRGNNAHMHLPLKTLSGIPVSNIMTQICIQTIFIFVLQSHVLYSIVLRQKSRVAVACTVQAVKCYTCYRS